MYEEIKALRSALTEERKLELGEGIPFSAADNQLVELRLQTALAVAARTIREEVETLNTETVEEKRLERESKK